MSPSSSGKELMEVVTPTRTFLVQFDTSVELSDWVEAFTALISSVRSQEPSQQTVGREAGAARALLHSCFFCQKN